ncbi:aspartate-alanine antiporter [Danxiaibacter flavus]|uniref:Aspartate-alanine antiporter n=1 Tax=Danxiaibacter flavus TaxID=3049108 RepID=A0ABV3ZF62_9BACT|nr:aspartate-alanine antiporter [Chitinophagaceae bacterium DXS]
MDWLIQTLRHYPELAVFLTLAVGFAVGKLNFGGFHLGPVTGVLLAGILVGQLNIKVSANVESVFFLLFLFSVGYGVGPQFFEGLKKNGLSQALFSLILCSLSLATAYVLSLILSFDAGTGAGLLAGANTSSTIIGVSVDTIDQLNLADDQKQILLNHVPVAYAVTYIFGTAGVAWFLAVVAPKMLGGNVKERCKELEASMEEKDENIKSAYDRVAFRAFHVEKEWFAGGKTAKELEQFMTERHKYLHVLSLRHEGAIVDVNPGTIIKPNDIVAMGGQRSFIIGAEEFIGDEMADAELLNFPVESRRVIVTNSARSGQTLISIRRLDFIHGISIRNLERGGIDMPLKAAFRIEKGDILEMVGSKKELDVVTDYLGFAEKKGNESDIIFIALGIVLGGLLGALAVRIKHVPLSLSTSGGALISGLLLGWLRSRKKLFGYIPTPSQWLMRTLGLNVFIAVVGIRASHGFVEGLKELGLSLFLAGIVVSMVPMIVGVLLGRYVFKFHPAITLGACAGAHNESAALGAVQDAMDSKVPALGYTVTYAVACMLLATYGVIMVALLQ